MAARPIPLNDQRDTELFLRALFGGAEGSAQIVLWTLEDRSSWSFEKVSEASAYAAKGTNIYVHAGVTTRPFRRGERPSADQIDGLIGVWADIDISSPVHKKGGLAANEDVARKIAESPGLLPSVIVHSGHGLQCWWLFREPWLFSTPQERQLAATLVRAWDISLRRRAAELHCTLDAVGDLPRLMRVAGTINQKQGAEPVAVRLLELNERRYSQEDLEERLLDKAWEDAEREISGRRANGTQRGSEGDLNLNPAAEPPFDKLVALLDNEPRAYATWQRTRRDGKNWSASEYDMALAKLAAQAGWNRQEIANLLIASRRKHGDDLKLRQDYYAMTIDKALGDQAERESVEEAVAMAEELRAQSQQASEESAPEPPIDRVTVLEKVSAAIGVQLTRIVRSTSEPPVFLIETPGAPGVLGQLGGIESVVNNRKFRLRVAELTNQIPRAFKAELWDQFAQSLLRVAEVEELGVEATLRGRVETWLSLYLGERLPRAIGEMEPRMREHLAHQLTPFRDDEDGCIRIFGTGFRRWLAEVQHEILPSQDFGAALRAYGAVPETRHFKTNSGRTTRAVWILPPQGSAAAQADASG